MLLVLPIVAIVMPTSQFNGTAVAIGCAVVVVFSLWPRAVARMRRLGIAFYSVILSLLIGLLIPLGSLVTILENSAFNHPRVLMIASAPTIIPARMKPLSM